MRRSGHPRDERGAVLVLASIVMVVLVIVTAFVIDLGQGRFARRSNQTIVDLAAVAAGLELAGNGGTITSDPRAACTAALASVEANTEGFTAPAGACNGYPTSTASCADPGPVQVTSGKFTVTIDWPVLDGELVSERFGSGADDGVECQRMSVRVQRTDSTAFAGVMGIDTVQSEATAVVVGNLDTSSLSVPAFLMVERNDCNVLTNSVGTGGGEGIRVNSPAAGEPGFIQVDSNASESCGGNAAGSVAVYATDIAGLPSLEIEEAIEEGEIQPGILAVRASGPRAAKFTPSDSAVPGINVDETASGISSRKPVDDKYNSGANLAIEQLHSDAYAALTGPVPATYHVVDCSLAPAPADGTTPTGLYVDCPGGFSGTHTFPPPSYPASAKGSITAVMFSHSVNLANADVVTFESTIDTIVVRGQLSINAGDVVASGVENLYVANRLTVDNNGNLAVRIGATVPASDTDCPTGVGAGAVRAAIFGGTSSAAALDIAGDGWLCKTTIYLGGPLTPTYTIQQDDSGIDDATCTAATPCPLRDDPGLGTSNATSGAHFEFQGRVAWTAPNEEATFTGGLEDLALWTEADTTSSVKSGAELVSGGVLFLPNAKVEMRSPATADPRNAQFVARALELFAGTLVMEPTPADSIPIEVPGTFRLIR